MYYEKDIRSSQRTKARLKLAETLLHTYTLTREEGGIHMMHEESCDRRRSDAYKKKILFLCRKNMNQTKCPSLVHRVRERQE